MSARRACCPYPIALAATIALLALASIAGAQQGGGGGGDGGGEPAGTAAPRASLPDVEDEVMCPICGTALNLSEAPQAERQRAFIRRRIAEGQTKEEIKDALVAEYGPEVLAVPEASGFDLSAWAVPIAAVLLGGLGIGIAVRRWRAAGANGSAEPRGAAIAEDDAERLDADLRRYDL